MLKTKPCIDTNILLPYSSKVFTTLDNIHLFGYVLGELDNLKKNGKTEEVKFQARRATRDIEKYKDKITYIIDETNYNLPSYYDKEVMDNKIIALLNELHNKDNGYYGLSNDLLFRAKCKALNIPCVEFGNNKDSSEDIYNGIREIGISEEENDYLQDNIYENIYKLYPNEYLIINNLKNNRKYLHMWNGEYLEEAKAKSIINSYLKNSKNYDDEQGKILPLDIYQRAFIHMLQNDNAKIKLTDSIYGAGKSYLMLHWAIQMIEKKKFRKLYFIKSDSPPKNRKDFPALPGGLEEKINPLLGVIGDSMSDENIVKKLIIDNKLEIIPIQFARGRSLRNGIICINEVQNFTPSEIEILISRAGENSVVLLDGSTRQIDNKFCNHRNGLGVASINFRDKVNSAQVNMINDYRSDISKMISEMDWHD